MNYKVSSIYTNLILSSISSQIYKPKLNFLIVFRLGHDTRFCRAPLIPTFLPYELVVFYLPPRSFYSAVYLCMPVLRMPPPAVRSQGHTVALGARRRQGPAPRTMWVSWISIEVNGQRLTMGCCC